MSVFKLLYSNHSIKNSILLFRDTDQQTNQFAPRKKVKAFSKNRGNKKTPIILSDLSVSETDSADDVAADIAKRLNEQKPELIGKNMANKLPFITTFIKSRNWLM